MLRITVTTRPQGTEITLEGRVVGPWAAELLACWQRLRATAQRPIRVDLDGVLFIDAAGRAALREMRAAGAVLAARGVMMRAVADEITATCTNHRDR
jgi:hypothetical protein